MQIRIDSIDFELPAWDEMGGIDWVVPMVEKVSTLARNTGTTSNAFLRRKNEIRSRMMKGEPFDSILKSRRDARIVSILWSEDKAFLKAAPPSKKSLQLIASKFSRPSQQVLINLLDLYFDEFDRLAALSSLCTTLSSIMKNAGKGTFFGNLLKIFDHKEILIGKRAAEDFAKFALKNKGGFSQCCHVCGLSASKSGRFLQLAKQKYYLETISDLEIGASSYVFDEVLLKSTKESPSERIGEFFGHDVIRAMIDRVNEANAVMPENWIKVILNIGGDPRLPKSSSYYQKWWSALEGYYRDLMSRWLSKYDLNLFLRVLQESSSTPEMRRMFPARRRFLEGLMEMGFVVESRLFLSRAARKFVLRTADEQDLPDFEELADANTSVIYLKLTKCHLIEGTHNYSLWLYDELPTHNPIETQMFRSLYSRDLGMGMKEHYEREKSSKRGDQPPYRIPHTKHGTWQHKAIRSMRRLGLRVDPERVLPPEDYDLYLKRFGA